MVSLHEARIAHTHIDRRTNHPWWGERFIVPVAHDVDALTVKVKDKDMVGSNFMGQVSYEPWLVTIIYGRASLRGHCSAKPLCDGQAERTFRALNASNAIIHDRPWRVNACNGVHWRGQALQC